MGLMLMRLKEPLIVALAFALIAAAASLVGFLTAGPVSLVSGIVAAVGWLIAASLVVRWGRTDG